MQDYCRQSIFLYYLFKFVKFHIKNVWSPTAIKNTITNGKRTQTKNPITTKNTVISHTHSPSIITAMRITAPNMRINKLTANISAIFPGSKPLTYLSEILLQGTKSVRINSAKEKKRNGNAIIDCAFSMKSRIPRL
jgi:hypothetical protein